MELSSQGQLMSEHEWDADLENKSDREQVLRERSTPWPKTLAELNNLIHEVTSGTHTYGSVVEAMGIVAAATLNYMGSELGVSGFQASCADLVTIRRQRLIKSPFTLVTLDNVLYPQYDLHDKLDEFISDCAEWISTEAQARLDKDAHAHPNVIQHWERLAKCKGDGKLISKVLRGYNPFACENLEPETTDCEVDDWDAAFYDRAESEEPSKPLGGEGEWKDADLNEEALEPPTVAPESNHTEG